MFLPVKIFFGAKEPKDTSYSKGVILIDKVYHMLTKVYRIFKPVCIVIWRLWVVLLAQFVFFAALWIGSVEVGGPDDANVLGFLGWFVGGWAIPGAFGGSWLPSSFIIFMLPLFIYSVPILAKIRVWYWLATIPIWAVWSIFAILAWEPVPIYEIQCPYPYENLNACVEVRVDAWTGVFFIMSMLVFNIFYIWVTVAIVSLMKVVKLVYEIVTKKLKIRRVIK